MALLTKRGFAAADEILLQRTGTGAPAPAAPVTGTVAPAAPAPVALNDPAAPASTAPASAPAAPPAPPAGATAAAPAAPALDPAEVGRWRKSHEELAAFKKQFDTVTQNNAFVAEKLETERKARETDAARLAALEAENAALKKPALPPEFAEQLGELAAPVQQFVRDSIAQAQKDAPKPLTSEQIAELTGNLVQTELAKNQAKTVEQQAATQRQSFVQNIRSVEGHGQVLDDDAFYEFIKGDPFGRLPVWDAAVRAGQSDPAAQVKAAEVIARIIGEYKAAKTGAEPNPPVIRAPNGAPSVPQVIQASVPSPRDIRRGAFTP